MKRHPASNCGWPSPTRVPNRKDHEFVPAQLIVEEISNPPEMQAAHTGQLGVSDLHTNARLTKQESEGTPKVGTKGVRCGRPVLFPPNVSPFDFARGAPRDTQNQRHRQRGRSKRAKSSSTEIVSPRSASAIASNSSDSSSGESSTDSSVSRASTTTVSPSGMLSPSTTSFPAMTVPVATCMGGWYTSCLVTSNSTPSSRRPCR